MEKIGFTTSIPVEVLFAAGIIPVDLNNLFINNPDNPSMLVEEAEKAGFPRNTCAWIKGIYSALLDPKNADIKRIIAVVEGDCSNARALAEVLETKGIRCIPFSYPPSRDSVALKKEISKLCSIFEVSEDSCLIIKKRLDVIRKRLAYLDMLTYSQGKVNGFENHLWQVSSSDFNGDHASFGHELESFIIEAERRPVNTYPVRLGYIGVPPINPAIYGMFESFGASIVYNEVQRQFTMADSIGIDDISEEYRRFTYPYFLAARLPDIKANIDARRIAGIVHYTQSFCFRGIEDIVFRDQIDVPVLTFEGDRPGDLDKRTMLRMESFVEMLKDRMLE